MPTSPLWNRSRYAALVYALIALIAIVWMRDTWTTLQQTEAVPHSELQRLLRNGQVDSVSNIAGASSQSPTATVG